MIFDPAFITLIAGGATLGIVGWLWRYVVASLDTASSKRVEAAKELADYKLHVAETYTAKTDMAAFDLKITAHLVRIEDKLDRVKKAPPI